jgi:CBS domain-containing membrane protein
MSPFACFVHTALAMGALGLLAWLTQEPFIFPALGATTFIIFWAPRSPISAPRNIVLSHALAGAIGWSAAKLLGVHAPAAVDLAHILAASLALGATSALMLRLAIAHPPAGATTVIFSQGLFTAPHTIAVVALGAAYLALHAFVVQRLTEPVRELPAES